MKTFGSILYDEKSKRWVIDCPSHVRLRFLRMFEGVAKWRGSEIDLSDSLASCRDLTWFLSRYPMKISHTADEYLKQQTAAAEKQQEFVNNLMTGKYIPRKFVTAMPLWDIQKIAGELILRTGHLLVADHVGLGKTITGATIYSEPKALPGVFVCLSHLPEQMEKGIKMIYPNLNIHIIKKGQLYDVTSKGKKPIPDVIVINYHKLGGWSDWLVNEYKVKSIIYDEIQEMRTGPGTIKYGAAKFISDNCIYRAGLSATPIYNYGGEIFHVMELLAPGELGTQDEFIREWCRQAGYGNNRKYIIEDPTALGEYLHDQGLMIGRTKKDAGMEETQPQIMLQTIDSDLEYLNKAMEPAEELAKIILIQKDYAKGEVFRSSGQFDMIMRQATGIAKAPFVVDYIKLLLEDEKKIALFGFHHEVYNIWAEKLAQFNPVFYTGRENTRKKRLAFNSFVNGDSRVIVFSLRTSAGLDGVQKVCRTVVFGELDWSPGIHTQCIGRIDRPGQTKQVIALYLVTNNGSDPVMLDVLGLKRDQADGIVLNKKIAVDLKDLQVNENYIKKLANDMLLRKGYTEKSIQEMKDDWDKKNKKAEIILERN